MKYLTSPRSAYVAARYDRKDEMLAVERVLEQHNIMPGTPWLHQDTDIRNTESDEERAHLAWIDIEGVLNADMLILFTEDLPMTGTVPSSWARGGRHTEYGIAIGAGIEMVIIGPRQNLLHFYRMGHDKNPSYRFDTLDEFIAFYDEENVIPDDAE